MKRLTAIIVLALLCLPFSKVSPASTKPVMLCINEFMADNKDTIEDPAKPGSFEDWIELYNAGASTINLGGMYLTDNLADPTQWQIPAGVIIPPAGYLLFWADGAKKQGGMHTSFKLSKEGEEIGLFDTDGVTVIDSIKFDVQLTDVSYGRYPNGGADWGFMRATAGAANSPHHTPPKMSGTTAAPRSPAKSDAVWITSTVTDDGAVADVTLTYKATGGQSLSLKMYDDGAHHDAGPGDGLFGAWIPAFAQDTVVKYYLTATDSIGAQSTAPAQAPKMFFSYVVGYVPPIIFINELMADSNAIIKAPGPDGTSGHEDWIELYNAGACDVDLGGMYLTDNLADPTQWQIPEGVTIPSGSYLLFWADEKSEQGALHADFKLSKSGESIGLFDTDARGNIAIDTVTFAAQTADISYGRIYDGGEPWVSFENPTPGSANFFPAGTHNFFWKFPQAIDSHTIIRKFSGSVSAVKRFNTASGQWEAAYPLWGNHPSGVHFLIEPEGKYSISISSPRSVSFKGNVFGR